MNFLNTHARDGMRESEIYSTPQRIRNIDDVEVNRGNG